MGEEPKLTEHGKAASGLAQTSLALELEVMRPSVTVRPERNLEKWPIWEPSNSRHQMQERMLQREIRLPDGGVAVARVKVGYTNNGALTTEDQKTCYALFRIWEEQGKPKGPIHFSRQQLVRVLKKTWGSKTNKAITESLMRLRFTPFEWERSYFDSERQETVERIDTFNILSELHLTRRLKGDRVVTEDSYFEFNERILANLLSGFTRPVYLETILSFQSEIAQILYSFLDLVMADKVKYERRTKELFADLGIDGTTYRYPSKRAQILRLALQELQEVPVPTGTLTVTLERTVDDTDFKIVARKNRRAGRLKSGGNSDAGLGLFDPTGEPAYPAEPGYPTEPGYASESAYAAEPPVVTHVVNAPAEPRKKAAATGEAKTPKNKPQRSPATGEDAPMPPGDAPVAEPVRAADAGAKKVGKLPVDPEVKEMAREQVRHFYQVFFQAGETARPTPREIAVATEHVTRLGVEKARYLIQFARREAKNTGFDIASYGGVAGYEGRAVSEFEANEKQRHSALSQRSQENHRQNYFPAYLAYLRERMESLEREPTPGFRLFLEEEEKGRVRLKGGKLSESPVVKRMLQSYDEPEARLGRLRDFLKTQMEKGKRLAEVLSFWEWDASLNPNGLPQHGRP